METEHRRDFPPGERRRRPAWHQTELSEGLAQPAQTYSESDSWQYGTGSGKMISPNLRSLAKQRHLFPPSVSVH